MYYNTILPTANRKLLLPYNQPGNDRKKLFLSDTDLGKFLEYIVTAKKRYVLSTFQGLPLVL